ncbi:uncharacterized protein K441DRAFT_686316 [Cenococcum geophilum 1.58]|uniref:uncharacterized protein n=1 Tax=Cenococcum geophilum 1.58 TaxID=794803 RepID=UPI00358E54FF|nr:hypothetical protein K441DRAFT_686316 [Cenococcum geophilum 1.58]
MGLLALPHAAQAILSCYGLYHSYQCIMKLRQYEERSEKAAKYSNIAAEQLYKTRTTQASAAIALAARMHVKEFWDNKARIPFVEGYNEAISGTAEIVRVLGLSGSLWAMEIVQLGNHLRGRRFRLRR